MFKHLFPKVFRLSLVGVLLIVFLSVLALTISNRAAIANKFTSTSDAAKETFSAQLANINENKVINFAVIVITWSGVGLVAYTVIWVGMLILTEARNEIVVETEYVNRGPLANRLKVPLIQIGLLIFALILLALSLNSLFPVWSAFFAEFIWRVPSDYLGAASNFAIAVGGLSLNAYVIKVVMTTLVSIE